MSASNEGATRGGGPETIGPHIRMPTGGPPLAAVAAVLTLFGLGLFLFLEGHRHAGSPPLASQNDASESRPVAQLPALEVPPAPRAANVTPPPPEVRYIVRQAPAPPPIIQYIDRPSPPPAPPMRPPPPAALGSGTEPALVADLGLGEGAAAKASEEGAVRATLLRNPSTLVPQGTVIPAVLETPLDSTRAGPARALTTADARGFDGARVLIPKGSRLLGDSNSGGSAGQTRILITWTRLIRPDGVTIRIGSPASDSLGGVGVAGKVNNHILARLTNAVLETALIAGSEIAARPTSGGVFIGLPSQAVSTTGQVLIPNSALNLPTITVRAGATITVFVAHDLDFAGTPRWP